MACGISILKIITTTSIRNKYLHVAFLLLRLPLSTWIQLSRRVSWNMKLFFHEKVVHERGTGSHTSKMNVMRHVEKEAQQSSFITQTHNSHILLPFSYNLSWVASLWRKTALIYDDFASFLILFYLDSKREVERVEDDGRNLPISNHSQS